MRPIQLLTRLALLLGLLSLSALQATAGDTLSADQLSAMGRKAFQQGAFEQAILSWTEALDRYDEAQKTIEEGQVLMGLVEAHQQLGQYGRALEYVQRALNVMKQLNDQPRYALLLGAAGTIQIAVGQEAEGEALLKQGVALARTIHHRSVLGGLLNDLGNLHLAKQQFTAALASYAEAMDLVRHSNRALAVAAQVSWAKAAMALKHHGLAKQGLDEAFRDARELPAGHRTSFTLAGIGLAYQELWSQMSPPHPELMGLARQAYEQAAAVAEAIGDRRAASYAWGYLGALEEQAQRPPQALDATRRAIFLAQQAVAPEALYRWHWQTGRLLKAMGQTGDAIGAYQRAVYALQSIRQETAFTARKDASSFRDTVGRLYFELADLLLQRSAAETNARAAEQDLKDARDVVELFKVGELRDYFRDDCVDAARAQVTGLEVVSKTAAIIYPILLDERTEILVSLPDGIRRVTVPVTKPILTGEIRAFRKFLEKRTTNEYLPHAQKLYDWLIRPLEPLLAGTAVDTLVFVPDGALRTVPMAALHDGKQFLIGKYAVATTPGLTLTDPRPLPRQNMKPLSGGVTEAVQGFPPLPSVSKELKNITELFGGRQLLNNEFLMARMEAELKDHPVSVLHIASHGQFESDVRKSFVLAFDEKLTMDKLNQYVGLFRFRDEPLALLTLSACETAAGDDRAALGLAGVAIKAGARSALATLWFINDEASSTLVSDFYRALQGGAASKAEALQRAQLNMLDHPLFYHPAYWSPFLLLNNWL